MSEQVHKSSEQVGDKEKEAIEKFKTLNIKHFNEETIYESDLLSYFDGILILNLIEKLQKENRELKDDQLWSEATMEGLKERFIPKEKIKRIRDKAECEDYYSLIDVIDDLSKLIGDYKEEKE